VCKGCGGVAPPDVQGWAGAAATIDGWSGELHTRWGYSRGRAAAARARRVCEGRLSSWRLRHGSGESGRANRRAHSYAWPRPLLLGASWQGTGKARPARGAAAAGGQVCGRARPFPSYRRSTRPPLSPSARRTTPCTTAAPASVPSATVLQWGCFSPPGLWLRAARGGGEGQRPSGPWGAQTGWTGPPCLGHNNSAAVLAGLHTMARKKAGPPARVLTGAALPPPPPRLPARPPTSPRPRRSAPRTSACF
jgi:hypothetical protein